MYHYLVWTLLQPFTLFLLLCGLGLVNLWRKRKETKRRLLLVTVPFLGVVLTCFPPLGYFTKGLLEWEYAPLDNRPPDVQAIAILSSSVFIADTVRHQVELDKDSLYRCLKAAEMFRQGEPVPILLCGGQASVQRPGPSNAKVMRDLLLQLGIPEQYIEIEEGSTSTYENAVEAYKILQPRGLSRILLITDANHMPRSVLCFRKQGFDVIPCGCQYRATPSSMARTDIFPNPAAALDQDIAFHEWVGMLWYWLKGRI